MGTRAHLPGQDSLVEPAVRPTEVDQSQGGAPGEPAERLSTAGAAYAAARSALDAALPAGWRRAAVESLPSGRAALSEDRSSAA